MKKTSLLVTITYRDNFTDLKGSYKHLSSFIQSLRYKYGKTFKYVCVPEFQKRGAVHFHALVWGLEKLREIEPRLKDKTDAEVKEIRGLLYGLGQLALETYFDSKEKKEI